MVQGERCRLAARSVTRSFRPELNHPPPLDGEGQRDLVSPQANLVAAGWGACGKRAAGTGRPPPAPPLKGRGSKAPQPTPAGRDREVLFTAGGTGAGKSSGLRALGGENAGIIYDTNMNTLASAAAKIDQALEAGWRVKLVYTYRDPIEAWVAGALPRAEKMGRTVPVEIHVETHIGARQVIGELAARYREDPRVTVEVVDNSLGKGNQRVTSLEDLPEIDQIGLQERLERETRSAHEKGLIGRETLRGSLGSREADLRPDPQAGGPGGRGADRGEPAQADGRDLDQPRGSESRASGEAVEPGDAVERQFQHQLAAPGRPFQRLFRIG
jgi:hypothetical protein